MQNKLKTITATDSTSYSLWNVTKTCLSNHKQRYPGRKQDGYWARSANDKDLASAEHMKDLLTSP